MPGMDAGKRADWLKEMTLGAWDGNSDERIIALKLGMALLSIDAKLEALLELGQEDDERFNGLRKGYDQHPPRSQHG